MTRLARALCLLALIAPARLTALPSLGSYFGDAGVEGSIAVYDEAADTWLFSDDADASVRSLPASTFKILNSLIALQEGAVGGTREVLRWDGRHWPTPSWNADTDMEGAFRNSVVWFYVELSRRLGRDAYRRYLPACGYGNCDLSEPGLDFWNFGELGVSPREQIEFLRRLRWDTLPFARKNMETVKSLMLLERSEAWTLRGKTGWTTKGGRDIGWFVGWAETRGGAYYFATRIVADDGRLPANFAASRRDIAERALRDLVAERRD